MKEKWTGPWDRTISTKKKDAIDSTSSEEELNIGRTSKREIQYGDKVYMQTTSSTNLVVEAMEELLGKFQDRYPAYQKRAQIPLCDIGERCAVKQGPRIGKLCDCSRGSSCNSFLLKCI
ncbi:cocaine- and amphetamine-regulated transcript protein-like isoform X1 [Eleutherodactylus coqui]|uniref:cocaine- and amphetamine-regulated transcript protein-like isoform X1 n=1 Tax=Eleutherodactylus coqui TaxID=57060 RepID=UPI0034637EBD